MKHYIKHDFPKLTPKRFDELKNKHLAKGPDFIKQQVNAETQLAKKVSPLPKANLRFRPPTLFKVSDENCFRPTTAGEFRIKINWKYIEPVDKTERFEQEIKTFQSISQKTNLTPCPLCCRVFLKPLASAEHVLLSHENFNIESHRREKPKFDSLL